MPPQTQEIPAAEETAHTTPKKDAEGYMRLGRTTLYFLILKYSVPAIVLFFVELVLLGAKAGGHNLPPFSEWVSADRQISILVGWAAGAVAPLFLIAIAYAFAMAYGYYYSFRYKLEDNDLSFERGIVDVQEISIPFRQIQNVDIEQSILYRMFKLADLVILTAGHEDPVHATKNESEIIMPALNVKEARTLQQYLLDRSNVQRTVVVSASTEPVEPAPLV